MDEQREHEDLAFPNPAVGNMDYEPQAGDFGMSLRDWFAGQALTEFSSYCDLRDPRTARPVADACYHMADAMIAAREGGAA